LLRRPDSVPIESLEKLLSPIGRLAVLLDDRRQLAEIEAHQRCWVGVCHEVLQRCLLPPSIVEELHPYGGEPTHPGAGYSGC
jgi:hypothetical protein